MGREDHKCRCNRSSGSKAWIQILGIWSFSKLYVGNWPFHHVLKTSCEKFSSTYLKVPDPPPPPSRLGRGEEGYPKVLITPPPQPRYLPPSSRSGWGRGYPKVPTPCPGQDEGGGTPRYLPPVQVRMREGVPQYTYPSSPVKVPTPPPPSRGTDPPTPPPPPPPPRIGHRTAYRVLDTLRSVCLLRSRRRTFLLEGKILPPLTVAQ